MPLTVQQRADEVVDAQFAQMVNFRIAMLEAGAAAYDTNCLPPRDDVNETVDALCWTIGLLTVAPVVISSGLFERDRRAAHRQSVITWPHSVRSPREA